MILMLLQSEFGESALITSCAHGHDSVSSLLIRKGANINYQTKVHRIWISYYMYMLLLCALIIDNVSHLLQKGWTPLLAACSEGYPNVVKELLQHPVQLEIENTVSQ